MAKAIMLQGTMSNVGKSLLTAAFCRIFRQDGLAAAPFKSQNMALNSYITREGLEMGRAQAVQAQAAGIEPSVLMNPILLKPSGDTVSQVIVNGEVLGNMSAREYFSMKRSLMLGILEAYGKLSAQYDAVVIEGAGSPAEINLKADDIVNMGLAKQVKAPVLLVGDIDRGGVFASMAGTLSLLEPEERAMVKGLIINKFRGDVSILEPGLRQIEAITGVPVLGVIPWMRLDIEEEDSLSERLGRHGQAGAVDIAVIRLPHLSNFTDFMPLEILDGVNVRYIGSLAQFGAPDLVILPGTKNTMEDLRWLRQSGLEGAVKKHAAAGKPVLGICGGYQMLGEKLSDPEQVESGGEMAGMGLLPVETVFCREKTRTRVCGKFLKVSGVLQALSGVPVEGYEIHMGRTVSAQPLTALQTQDGVEKLDGAQRGPVYGTYLHGLFDREEAAEALLKALCQEKGISSDWAAVDFQAYREQQYDQLADVVRAHTDMEKIYQILQEGIGWKRD